MAISSAAGRAAWAENAVDTIAAHFEQAHNTLLVIEHQLEAELKRTYGAGANPMKLLSELHELQEELSLVEADCKKLMAAKREFVEKTLGTLAENRNTLNRLEARAGLSSESFDDQGLHKIFDDWKNLTLEH